MMNILQQCGEISVYLAGAGFVLGSLFSIFILVIFELIKKIRESKAGS